MIQPISGPPPGQPPGQGDNLPSGAGNQPLSSQQRTSLESLMTKVTKLAAATGEPSKQIWQSMLELSGVKDGELIPAKLFNHLVTWLQARQTLSQQNTPTLESLQMTLKQPLDASELAALSAYIQQKYGLSACRNGGLVAALASPRCMGRISGRGVNRSRMFAYLSCAGRGGG